MLLPPPPRRKEEGASLPGFPGLRSSALRRRSAVGGKAMGGKRKRGWPSLFLRTVLFSLCSRVEREDGGGGLTFSHASSGGVKGGRKRSPSHDKVRRRRREKEGVWRERIRGRRGKKEKLFP